MTSPFVVDAQGTKMSLKLAAILAAAPKKKRNRAEILALVPPKKYDDGRTKQCHADECDIEKIMARFARTGTISHLEKYEAVYADYSDVDFHTLTNQLTRGREIFDDLPAELRREFGQNPQAFFSYVNDPANADDLRHKLPGLAKPGTQLPTVANRNDADVLAATAAASEPMASETNPPESPTTPE